MKKRYVFLLILLLFIIYVALYCIFVPKVIFINKSGYDIHIFGYYVDNAEKLRKKSKGESQPLKMKSESLRKDQKTSYRLGFFSNKNRESFFLAYWSLPIKKNDTLIQNRMNLPKEDFGWKNVTFIIDENGDYHKVEKSQK